MIHQIRQKPKETDFYFSWLVQRRLAKPIVYLLKDTKATPNQISFISILIGLVGIYYLFYGSYKTDLIGILFLHLAAILDCADGDLARTKIIESDVLGKFVDYSKVIIVDPLIPISLAIGLVNNKESLWWLILIIIVSFWKIAPQFARQHVVVRTLHKAPEKSELYKKGHLYSDPQHSIKRRNNGNSVFYWGIWVLKLIIGLPNALLNTILVISISGWFISFTDYFLLKKLLLGLIIISYLGFFMKSLSFEIRKLRAVNQM